jgi:hypothetical protein
MANKKKPESCLSDFFPLTARNMEKGLFEQCTACLQANPLEAFIFVGFQLTT